MATGTVHHRVIGGVAALVLAVAAGLPACADGCRVAVVVDGDTLACDDGRTLRLASLRAPKPAAWEMDADFANESREGLSALVLGRSVAWSGASPDRHGRLRVQVRRDDGVWVQAEMLRRGLAMVETQRDMHQDAAALLSEEEEARAGGRGLWAVRRYQIQPADGVRGRGWRIVEGRITGTAKRNGVVFLNFGADWHKDFTVRLAGDALRDCAAAGLDPLSLQGRRLLVRGWVEWRHGPELVPDHLQQLQWLD